MADVLSFPQPADGMAVIIPDDRGYRVVLRNRPDLASFEAVFRALHPATVHAMNIAKDHGVHFVMTPATVRKGAGL